MPADVPSRTWVLPGEPVAVRLMNTIWADGDGLHDDLLTPRDVEDWLDAVRAGPAGAPATDAELATARGLRKAVRRLAAFVTADARQAAAAEPSAIGAALRRLNSLAAQAPGPALILRGDHLERGVQPHASSVTAGLARVAGDAIGLLGGDGAGKLRACHAPGCVLYFVKTHPRREWCSVSCGNRVRAARHYQRTRAPASAAPGG